MNTDKIENMENMTTVAVVQATPVLFDRVATIEKVDKWVKKASEQGAQLLLFPEAFIPAYPRGMGFGAVVGSRSLEGRKQWQRYYEQSLAIPGPGVDALAEIAGRHQVFLAIGVIEREARGGTLYCTLLYFGPDGRLLGKHRKLKPTGSERLIWGEGDGSSLTTLDTNIGRIGGLICWENYMPLARMAMYQQGVQIYLAPTADARDSWESSMVHIACEGRCFVLSCNQYVQKSDYPKAYKAELKGWPDIMSRGGSMIVSPLGEVLAGPLYDQEGILYADIDVGETIRGKMDFDVVGHYGRPDVFRFEVNGMPEILSV
ncbi:MAG: carbon-nitrogen hydrolase family protein [Bacteroidota bacterium]